MGWTGEAAAASLTMVLRVLVSWESWSGGLWTHQTSCFWFATRAAGLKGSSRLVVADMARSGVVAGCCIVSEVVGNILLVGWSKCREAAVARPLISNDQSAVLSERTQQHLAPSASKLRASLQRPSDAVMSRALARDSSAIAVAFPRFGPVILRDAARNPSIHPPTNHGGMSCLQPAR